MPTFANTGRILRNVETSAHRMAKLTIGETAAALHETNLRLHIFAFLLTNENLWYILA